MQIPQNQGKLFATNNLSLNFEESNADLELTQRFLSDWQKRICAFQASLFKEQTPFIQQKSLFNEKSIERVNAFNPLQLAPLPISFWRWPDSPYKGQAIYIVMDKPKKLGSHLVLYIGETISAETRWKGDHDCKEYISAYSGALTNAGINHQLSIRFWTDVPIKTKPRRLLEQYLIQKWQPPFNKETRNRWKTPFTAD